MGHLSDELMCYRITLDVNWVSSNMLRYIPIFSDLQAMGVILALFFSTSSINVGFQLFEKTLFLILFVLVAF